VLCRNKSPSEFFRLRVLANYVSRYVLDQILFSTSTEGIVSLIHEYLTPVSENVRGGKVEVNDFIVHLVVGRVSHRQNGRCRLKLSPSSVMPSDKLFPSG
jgi:hypothetical protein